MTFTILPGTSTIPGSIPPEKSVGKLSFLMLLVIGGAIGGIGAIIYLNRSKIFKAGKKGYAYVTKKYGEYKKRK